MIVRINMAKRRNLATFVLLAHLVSSLRGNYARDLEVIFMGETDDTTRDWIEARASRVKGELLENITTTLSAHEKENFSESHLAPTSASELTDEEKRLEGELEEALEEIASFGRVVSISLPEIDDTNSTKEIPAGSLILIESSLTTRRSPIEANNEEGIDRSGTIYDQEIAQSRPVVYARREDIENIEDLLAIAEYEPQKIDAVRIEATSPRNPLEESTRAQFPEETHYDVPRRRNVSKNTRRTRYLADETLRPNTNPEEFSSRMPLEIPSHLNQLGTKKERTRSRPQLPVYSDPTGGNESSLASKLHDKLTDDQQRERSRKSRHSKPSFSRTPSSPLFPPLSENLKEQLNYSRLNNSRIRNVTVFEKALKKKVGPRSLPSQSSPVIVPAIEQNKIPLVKPQLPHHPKIRPVPDHQQLGFLTRYNMPSLLMPRLAKLQSHSPVTQRTAVPKHFEVDNRESSSLDNENLGHPRIHRPDYDYEEDSDETIQAGRIATRTRGVVGNSDEPLAYKVHGVEYGPSTKTSLSISADEPLKNPITIHNQSYRNSEVKGSPSVVRQSPKAYPVLPGQGIRQSSDYAGEATKVARPLYSSNATVPAYEEFAAVEQEENKHEVREVGSAGDDYSVLSKNALVTPSSRPPYDNPQETLIPTLRIASRPHRKNSNSETEKSRVDGTWEMPSTTPEHRPAERQNNPPTSFARPEYDFYEREESAVEPALKTSITGSPEEPQSGNYGNRVGSLMPQVVEESLQPRTVYRTRTLELPIRLDVAPTMKEKPAESLSRADVVDREDHEGEENEETSGSSHEEHRQVSKKEVDADEEVESKGGGEKNEEGHRTEGSEKGEKGYKEWHEYDEGAKGHRDNESHEKEYDEKKGDERKDEDESGYHKEYNHSEKGNKDSEFGEKGEHEKGHSTKGQHVVHKKDEYEKNTEFYDESHEEDGDEKEGGYRYERENEKGGREKIGHHDAAYGVDKHGERAEHEKARHWDESSGHENKDGRERDHRHEERYGKTEAREKGEKWSHKNADSGKR